MWPCSRRSRVLGTASAASPGRFVPAWAGAAADERHRRGAPSSIRPTKRRHASGAAWRIARTTPALAIRRSTTSSGTKSARSSPGLGPPDQLGEPIEGTRALRLHLAGGREGRRQHVLHPLVGGLHGADVLQEAAKTRPGIRRGERVLQGRGVSASLGRSRPRSRSSRAGSDGTAWPARPRRAGRSRRTARRARARRRPRASHLDDALPVAFGVGPERPVTAWHVARVSSSMPASVPDKWRTILHLWYAGRNWRKLSAYGGRRAAGPRSSAQMVRKETQ